MTAPARAIPGHSATGRGECSHAARPRQVPICHGPYFLSLPVPSSPLPQCVGTAPSCACGLGGLSRSRFSPLPPLGDRCGAVLQCLSVSAAWCYLCRTQPSRFGQTGIRPCFPLRSAHAPSHLLLAIGPCRSARIHSASAPPSIAQSHLLCLFVGQLFKSAVPQNV